jgi:hypothetical protein
VTAPVAAQRILRGTAAVLTWQNLNADGEAADPGTVTVGVVDAAGNTVVPSSTATTASGTARAYTLTAEQTSDLNLLTATWTVDGGGVFQTSVEVVGGYYFSVAEARAGDPQLSNDTRFPTDQIIAARRQVEEEFERICEVAFVPRYEREHVWSTGGNALAVSFPRIRSLRSVAWVDPSGAAQPYTSTDRAGMLHNEGPTIIWEAGGFPAGQVTVEYEHGYDVPPAEVKWAAIQRCRYWVAKTSSGIPDKAQTYTILESGGTVSLARASALSTGNDDIDAILGRWSHRVFGFA